VRRITKRNKKGVKIEYLFCVYLFLCLCVVCGVCLYRYVYICVYAYMCVCVSVCVYVIVVCVVMCLSLFRLIEGDVCQGGVTDRQDVIKIFSHE
jgi:hypothetical protein